MGKLRGRLNFPEAKEIQRHRAENVPAIRPLRLVYQKKKKKAISRVLFSIGDL